MKNSSSALKRNILPGILLFIFGMLFVVPFVWLVSTSFKAPENVFKFPPQWIPAPFKWQNYIEVFNRIPFLLYLKNTLIIAVVPVIGQILSSSIVAYSFSKIPWKGSRYLFGIVLATMMLPFQVTMIPLYIVWSKLDLVNTFAPLLVPSFFGSAYYIFLLRQFFKGIPDSLIYSVRIDGASELRILFSIVLPLSKPALTTIGLFTFMGGWNDFMGPLIYFQSSKLFTLPLGLQTFMFEMNRQWEVLMAASTLFTIPVIILFFIGQKQFVKGIVMTGFK